MDLKSAFEKANQILQDNGFEVVNKDDTRPWGGFLVINEAQAPAFAQKFFPDFVADIARFSKLSPKILLVAPHKRLSWQYHFRRAEIWRCLEGPVKVATSLTDEENEIVTLQENDIIRLQQGERHRLMGCDNWGLVAEIWQHTQPELPSDEEDIVRLQDDFERK